MSRPERGGREMDRETIRAFAYVQALGGEVEIRARVAGQEVAIKEFREVGKLKAALAPGRGKKKTA